MGKFDGIFIASDMDGTLLNDERTIGAETIEALEYFTANGGHFSLATGRTRPGTAAYRKILPCNSTGVYLNGAIICDERTEQVVYREGLDDRAKELAREASIQTFKMGDVNDDDEVNAFDVMLVQSMYLGEDVTLNADAADVNGDGEINVFDAILIQDVYLSTIKRKARQIVERKRKQQAE